MVRVAINGYGRIGRNIVRALYSKRGNSNLQIIAINDIAAPEVSAHLTRFDSTHGRFGADVRYDNEQLIVDDHKIQLVSENDPKLLPWRELDIQLVFECVGNLKERNGLTDHLTAGAAKVLASYPVKDADFMVVYGVNHQDLLASHQIVSNASCTTNCLAPMVKVIQENVGIEQGYMTTIHSYTNDQALIDRAHTDLYHARSATQSMIPATTGAATAIGEVIPELKGKLYGMAVRVPTQNVSLVDLVLLVSKKASVGDINRMMRNAVAEFPSGVLEYSDLPLVSVDFNHNSSSCVFDATQTHVNGKMMKIMAWYDNEWGFSNRMLDVATLMC